MWVLHFAAFVAFLVILPDHEAAAHDHVADEHVPEGQDRPRAR
jgi:hypothetical protein